MCSSVLFVQEKKYVGTVVKSIPDIIVVKFELIANGVPKLNPQSSVVILAAVMSEQIENRDDWQLKNGKEVQG